MTVWDPGVNPGGALERARLYGGRVEMRHLGPLVLDGLTFAGAGRGTILDFRGMDPELVKANHHSCVTLLNGASLRDVTVIGLSDYDDDEDNIADDTGLPVTQTAAVRCFESDGSMLTNVYATGGRHACISIQGGKDITLSGCHAWEDRGMLGLAYGLSIGGGHNVTVNGGSFHGMRHGVAMGNKPDTGEVIGQSRFARGCTVIGARISSDIIYAADFHPGVERCAYVNCDIQGGLNFAGKHNRVSGGHISSSIYGEAIHLHSLSDFDVDIEGVRIFGDAQDRGLIWYDRTPFDEVHPTGGLMRIRNCRIEAEAGVPFYFRNRFTSACSFALVDNIIRSPDGSPGRFRYWGQPQNYAGVDHPAGVPWDKLIMRNNGLSQSLDIPNGTVTTIDADGDYVV